MDKVDGLNCFVKPVSNTGIYPSLCFQKWLEHANPILFDPHQSKRHKNRQLSLPHHPIALPNGVFYLFAIKYLEKCYCYDDDLVTLPESPFAYFRAACFGKHNFDASLGFEQKDCSEPTLSCSSTYLQNKIGGFCLFWGSLTNKRYTIF